MLTIDKAEPKRQPASATRGPYLSPSDDNMICKTSRCQAFNPLISPNTHAISPNWSPCISIKNKLREFDKSSKHLPFGDYFIDSHNLFS